MFLNNILLFRFSSLSRLNWCVDVFEHGFSLSLSFFFIRSFPSLSLWWSSFNDFSLFHIQFHHPIRCVCVRLYVRLFFTKRNIVLWRVYIAQMFKGMHTISIFLALLIFTCLALWLISFHEERTALFRINRARVWKKMIFNKKNDRNK